MADKYIWNMSEEEVDAYLREHGIDPEEVVKGSWMAAYQGTIERAEAAEQRVEQLEHALESTRFYVESGRGWALLDLINSLLSKEEE